MREKRKKFILKGDDSDKLPAAYEKNGHDYTTAKYFARVFAVLNSMYSNN